jgi:SAM-dependent methyltransferase
MPPENGENQPPVCDYEGSDYQETFWDQGGREYEDRVEAIALQHLLPPRGKLLLEIGAGAGRNTTRYKGFDRIVLMDYSLTQLRQAQERLGRSERYLYVAANVYGMPFEPGLFDTATMIRVLHHLADAPRALEEVRLLLQPDGVFILEYANKRNLKAILRYLLRRQEWNPFDLDTIEFAKLNFDFHPTAVRSWLLQFGFQIQHIRTVSHFRLPVIKRIVPLKLLVALDALLQPTGALWQFTPSVFVRAGAVGNTPIAKPGTFFRCPLCNQALEESDRKILECPGGVHKWAIRDGIYDFKAPVNQPPTKPHVKT